MQANQRVSAPGSSPLAASTASYATRDLPLPKMPEGAILASNNRESEECQMQYLYVRIRGTTAGPALLTMSSYEHRRRPRHRSDRTNQTPKP